MGVTNGFKTLLLVGLACMDSENLGGKLNDEVGALEVAGFLHIFVVKQFRDEAAKDLYRHLRDCKSVPYCDLARFEAIADSFCFILGHLITVNGCRKLILVLEGDHPLKFVRKERAARSVKEAAKGNFRRAIRPPDCLVKFVIERALRCDDLKGKLEIIFAPHDADGQLAFLLRTQQCKVAIVPSNDSDFALFHSLKGHVLSCV